MLRVTPVYPPDHSENTILLQEIAFATMSKSRQATLLKGPLLPSLVCSTLHLLANTALSSWVAGLSGTCYSKHTFNPGLRASSRDSTSTLEPMQKLRKPSMETPDLQHLQLHVSHTVQSHQPPALGGAMWSGAELVLLGSAPGRCSWVVCSWAVCS